MYILVGFLALGAMLDSVANAISLMTPLVAGLGTACIVLLWVLARLILPSHPLPWVVGNQRVRVQKLGIQSAAYAVGMVLLLWMPSVITRFQTPPPSSSQLVTDVREIVAQLVKAHERELVGLHQREQAYQDQVKALTETVTALAQRKGPLIADALAQLREGNTEAAERIFQDILTRKADEGRAANQQAADAARHLGVLAALRGGNLHDAIDKFNAALTLYRQAHDSQGEAKSMYNLGLAYSNQYELQRALDHLNRALPLLQAAQEPAFEARALVNIGLIYQEPAFKDDRKTLDYYLKALPLLHTAATPGEEATILQGIGDLYHRIGEEPKAIDYFERALPVARLANAQDTQVNVLGLLGHIYYGRLEYKPALEYYRQALALLQGPGLQDRRAGLLRLMGDISSNLGELAKALGYYNDALASARTAKDPAKEADIYNALANFYMRTLKDPERARDYYTQALALWQTQAGERAAIEQARTLVSIGLVNFVLNEYDAAISLYNLALPWMETAGSLADRANLFTKLGDAYRWKRDYPRALDSYNKAVPFWRAAHDHAGEVNTLRDLAFTEILSQRQIDMPTDQRIER
jgi:tetratricopeptide (TPR) repeat protein